MGETLFIVSLQERVGDKVRMVHKYTGKNEESAMTYFKDLFNGEMIMIKGNEFKKMTKVNGVVNE